MQVWAYILGAATMVAGAGMVINSFGERAEAQTRGEAQLPRTAHEITLTRIDGRPMPLDTYRGQVMLVVNTASKCGLTPQYEGLVKLQQAYAKRGFTVIGIPSADFMGQEFSDNSEIEQFCETRFGVNFPLTERSRVTGNDANVFHRWARANLSENNVPRWNFHKFLVGRDGRVIAGFGSRTDPTGPEITRAIERALSS
jgi:glutathione peroxidase